MKASQLKVLPPKFKKGDVVYNVPHQKHGIVLRASAHGPPLPDEQRYERLFWVLWSDGTKGHAGDTFLRLLG